ncbi:hypothetical protein PG996_007933 [Apiospora saccharicola]|uniref:Uncharacterized protein n=1 Tax=Apiospora saccharicola TaxID=335842 RepID=A0ABR1UWH0_9PEZI
MNADSSICGCSPSSALRLLGKTSRIPRSLAHGADRVYWARTWLSVCASTRYCGVNGVQLFEKNVLKSRAAPAAEPWGDGDDGFGALAVAVAAAAAAGAAAGGLPLSPLSIAE